MDALAHDLRTPLTSIKASVCSLRERDVAWSEAHLEAFLSIIEDETDRLSDVVGQLLDSARIRANAIVAVMRPVIVLDVVAQAVASVGGDAFEVSVQVDDELAVVADSGLLARVVANLVSNALKHGGVASTVLVTADRRDTCIRICVVDRGPGIPQSQRDRVFEPFAQLGQGDTRDGRGVGLGLAIAGGFVRSMGGAIAVEDTAGGGTTVVVELCAASSEQ